MAQEKSLIEEALSDAEQVRETALANAKAQLEEAFTPRIQSMVSKQLKTELDEETDGYDEDGKELDDPLEEEEEDEFPDDEYDDEEEEDEEEIEEEMGDAEEDEEGDALPDPTNADDAELDEEEEDPMDDDDFEDEEEGEEADLDLEAVIAELESEVNEEDEDMEDDDEEEIDDEDEEEEEIVDLEELLKSLDEEEDDEELDLEELFNSLEEGDSNDDLVETLKTENQKLTSENAEYREAVEILRSKLNEVNLLNAKLLYTSKLFKKYNLNNSQKMKVVESFDRTKSVRETKLVYSTIAESFQLNGGSSKKSKRQTASITEGLASKPVKSTKPNKGSEIIKESNDITDRFKKLVNYNK